MTRRGRRLLASRAPQRIAFPTSRALPWRLQAVFPNLESRLDVRMIGTPVTAQVR